MVRYSQYPESPLLSPHSILITTSVTGARHNYVGISQIISAYYVEKTVSIVETVFKWEK